MATETLDQRVERLSRESGGEPTTRKTPDDVQRELDQDFDYLTSTGSDRVVKRKEAFERYGLTPPTHIASPGALETDPQGPVRTFVRPMLEGVGLVGGALVGSGLGPMGGVAGGALGYAGGDTLSSALERMAGERPPLQSGAQAAVETGKALLGGAATEATGQIMGKVVGGVLGKIGAPFKAQYEGENRSLEEIAKGKGIQLDPHEILQNRPLALGHKVLENIPFTSGMIQRKELEKVRSLTSEWDKLREQTGTKQRARIGEIGQRIQDTIDKELDRIGVRQADIRETARDQILQAVGSPLTYKALGEQSQAVLKEHYAGLKAVENAAWDYARGVAPEGRFVTSTLPKEAEAIKKEFENIPSFLDEPLGKQLADVGGSGNKQYDRLMMQVMKDIDERMPLAIRQKLIQAGTEGEQPGWTIPDLISLRRELSAGVKAHHTGMKQGDVQKGSADVYGRVYTKLLKAVDTELDAIAKRTQSDFNDRLKIARAATGERVSFFNPKESPAVVKAINADPAQLASTLIQPGSAAGFTALKDLAGGRAVEPVKKAFTNQLFDVGGKEEAGLSGLRAKLDRYGVQTLAEVYNPSELKNLYALADRAKWQTKSPIGNPFFRELIKTAPRQVAPTILETPELTSKVIRQFPAMKQDLRTAFVEGIKPNDTTPFPTQMLKHLNAYPPEVQKQLFTTDELKDFYNLAKVIDRTKSSVALAENPTGAAQNLVTFATSGMVIKHPIAMAPTVLGTSSIARLYLSPLGRKYLLEGLVEPATTMKATYLASQLMGVAGTDFARNQQDARRARMGIGQNPIPSLEAQP